jgi:hypothetical protein
MRPNRLLLSLLPIPFLMAGCATMDADQCRQADWRAVGLRDGQNGEPPAMMERRAKDCADNQVKLDVARYQEGRNQGLPQFCRVDQAARFGLEGKPYHGVCPPAIDAEFKRRHAVGWEVNQARAAMRDLDTRQQSPKRACPKPKPTTTGAVPARTCASSMATSAAPATGSATRSGISTGCARRLADRLLVIAGLTRNPS